MNIINKVDEYLGLPPGSIQEVIIKKQKLSNVITALSQHGIILDEKLRISDRKKWRELRKKAGVENRTGFDDDKEPVKFKGIG